MMTIARISLAYVVVALAFSGAAADQESTGKNDYTRTVSRPYEEVLASVKQAAQAHGFRVSNVHDIAASLRKDGIQREPYATVEVCNSKIAAQVLNAEPLLGSVMPCRIAVFQKGKETTVSMLRPSKLMALFPTKAEVAKEAAEVEISMRAIVDEATRQNE
jgi:uncharacterized protein (DUF302 family)